VANPPRYLDTNVLLRLLTRDDENKAARARALLMRIERGDERVVTSSLVVFEVVFTLQSFYKVPKGQIREMLLHLISMRALGLAGKSVFRRAFDMYVDTAVSFADAYTVAAMEARGLREVYSWDLDFDHIPGITRVEPE